MKTFYMSNGTLKPLPRDSRLEVWAWALIWFGLGLLSGLGWKVGA